MRGREWFAHLCQQWGIVQYLNNTTYPNPLYPFSERHISIANIDNSRYDDIKEVSSNNDKYISYICAVGPADPRGIRRPPFKFDGENRKPYCLAVDRTLKPAQLRRIKPIIRRHCERELQVLIDRGHGDLYEEFASNLTSWVEKEWLSLDEADSALLLEHFSPFGYAWRVGEWNTVKIWSDA